MAEEAWRPKALAGLLFVVGSIGAGLLVAGLAAPTLLLSTTVVNTAANDFNEIPLELKTPPQPQATKVYLADGSLLATFADEYRVYVPLSDISPYMQQAQVAIEDKRFFEHGAIDATGLIRATIGNLIGETDRGASSITQQYVKMVRVEVANQANDADAMKAATELTLSRKIIEMRYALQLERQLSKDEILERYLNMAYYGDHVYGVEAAAEHYFGATAATLTLPQAAMLAGIVQQPSAYSPTNDPVASVQRRNTVLDVMAESDVADITPAEAAAAKAVPWDPSLVQNMAQGCQSSRYPFICQYVELTLEGDAMTGALGLSPDSTSDARKLAVERGGYTVQTVINPAVQDAVQEVISNKVAAMDPAIAAMAIVQPGTGLILSMAQSRPVMGTDASQGQTYYNYAVDHNMGGAEGFQTGSTFKVFTLANALSLGVPFDTMYVTDAPMQFGGQVFQSCSGPVKAAKTYNVRNSEGSSGPITLPVATANSVNTYFMQLERDTGICGAVMMAQAAGVKLAMEDPTYGTTDLVGAHFDAMPSFTLGAAEVSPLTMAEAYATFAANGVHCDPIILESMTDADGNDVPVPDANCQQTIDPNVAAGVDALLQGVMRSGTGAGANIPGGYPQAGKSGTTDSGEYISFGGYTPYVCGFATIAYDKMSNFWQGRRITLRGLRLPYSGTYLNGFGGPDTGQIWRYAMAAAVAGTPPTPFPAYYPVDHHWSSPNTYKPPAPDQPDPNAPPGP
ncbi:MAG: penicillin-binding protein [Propionibacteriaceae bacterium]|nr:penicillin-binding protein [Propionibacteriaceae bacterium]